MEKIIFFACLIFFLTTQNVYSVGVQPYELNELMNQPILKQELVQTLEKVKEVGNISSQIKILELKWKGNELIINLSDEVISYGGGNSTEFIIGQLIMDWAFTYTDAATVTILVNGKSGMFPEGNDFYQYTRETYRKNSELRKEFYEENHICDNKPREN